MLYDSAKAQTLSAALLALGIYVIGFFYPVVPKDQARIRVQVSAAHEREHLDRAVTAFTEAGKRLAIV
jgi:glycine C-acetyltransferase